LSLNQVDIEKVKHLHDVDSAISYLYSQINKTEALEKALAYSTKAHENQFRRSGLPYIIHPILVASIVSSITADESMAISALLHDVVEDTDITLEVIKEKFGDEVELLVDGLTKINIYTESREQRKIETLKKILLASAKDIRVLIIKLCDRLHNLRTIEELPENKRERVSNETLEIFAPIAQKIGIYSLKWELEDLSFKYLNREMYQLIKDKVKLDLKS